jgi:hypothetical protein
MVKTKYIIFALFLFIFIIFTGGCVGGNGNPLELVGDWKESHTDIGTAGNGNANSYTEILTFKGDGSFSLFHEEQGNPTGSPLFDVTATGYYYGDPMTTPKMVSIDIKKISLKMDGVDVPEGDATLIMPSFSAVTGSFGGNYWIQSTKPNKLGLTINSGQYIDLRIVDSLGNFYFVLATPRSTIFTKY